MAVRIGHASGDEHGKASGGKAGDQTGKEVCTRTWYDRAWNVVLRPRSAVLAEKSALACEAACANKNIGYDQGGRNTLNAKARAVDYDLSRIDTACECDCSSLMHVCAIAGGANLEYGANGYTTSTMVKAYIASGDYEQLTASKYLTGDKYLKRGDILVREGKHTAMALEDGALAEPSADVYQPDLVRVHYSVRLPMLMKGMVGEDVRGLQQLLLIKGYELPRYGADGEFGDETENALLLFQEDRNLKSSGVCDQATWGSLLGVKGVG